MKDIHCKHTKDFGCATSKFKEKTDKQINMCVSKSVDAVFMVNFCQFTSA